VFENRVLKGIFGSKRHEATGEWKRLPNEELYALYFSLRVIKSRRARWVGHVARMGDRRRTYRVSVGRRQFGKPRRRLEDVIIMDIQEVGWGMGWIELAQKRDRWLALVNAIMNLRVP
jgi:hypothetical protein